MNGVIAIIPARGGSKGIKNKNLQHVGGIPLVARTILACKQSRMVDDVYVSTDNSKIARVAIAYGAKVIERPSELALDSTSSESVLLHALQELENQNIRPQTILFAQCTSPLTQPSDVDGILRIKSNYDSCFTVAINHSFLWRLSHDQTLTGVNHDYTVRLPRQQLPIEYVETGSLFALDVAGFKKSKHRFFGKMGVYEIPADRSIDVDTPADLAIANALANFSPTQPSPETFQSIKAVIFDFDGVFTDNLVSLNEDGIESVLCSRSDGVGIKMLQDSGIQMLILSKERNLVVSARGKKLGVEVVQGCDDKKTRLTQWVKDNNLELQNCAYIGNDINDYECMEMVGLSVAPVDAHPDVDEVTIWKLRSMGGRGAIREFADSVVKNRIL
jgi:N-acylneuraminate cytidylyltransferase